MESYVWLRGSAHMHRQRGNPSMADRFDRAADDLREATVARIVAQNPGINEAEVRADFEARSGGRT